MCDAPFCGFSPLAITSPESRRLISRHKHLGRVPGHRGGLDWRVRTIYLGGPPGHREPTSQDAGFVLEIVGFAANCLCDDPCRLTHSGADLKTLLMIQSAASPSNRRCLTTPDATRQDLCLPVSMDDRGQEQKRSDRRRRWLCSEQVAAAARSDYGLANCSGNRSRFKNAAPGSSTPTVVSINSSLRISAAHVSIAGNCF
jgi:hypothetical protein